MDNPAPLSVAELLALLQPPASAPSRTASGDDRDRPHSERYFAPTKGILPAPPPGQCWTGAFHPKADFIDRNAFIRRLDVGYRPLLQGEPICKEDEYFNRVIGCWERWSHALGHPANVGFKDAARTRRPVPVEFLLKVDLGLGK